TLKFVHCPDVCTRQSLLNFENLGIVRRYDNDLVESDGLFRAVAINPHRFAFQNALDERADGSCFFGRAILIAVVDDGEVAQTGAANRTSRIDRLHLQTRPGDKLAVVEKLGGKRADIRMQSPGLFEEEALVRRYGPLAT